MAQYDNSGGKLTIKQKKLQREDINRFGPSVIQLGAVAII